MKEISQPVAVEAQESLREQMEEWTKRRDEILAKRVPPDKAPSEKDLMFRGEGKLGKGGPRKSHQPPSPTEMSHQNAKCQPATGHPADRRMGRSGSTRESSAPQMPIGMEARVRGGSSRHGEDQTQRVDPVRQRELRAHSVEDQTQRVDRVRHLELRAQRPFRPERKVLGGGNSPEAQVLGEGSRHGEDQTQRVDRV